MADNLQILGKTYTNVAGIKAVNSNGDTLTFVKGGGGGSSGNLELIGETTIALEEWTDTVNADNVDTGINIASTDYAWILVFVTCDSAITTSNEWGMTATVLGRYTSNRAACATSAGQQKGSSTLSFSAMTTNTMSGNSYGVWILNNAVNIGIARKAHGSACPKIRGGNYTIKAYGVTSI